MATDPQLDVEDDAAEKKAEKKEEDKLKNDLSPEIWQKYHQLGGQPVFGQQVSDLLVVGPTRIAVRFQHGCIAAQQGKGAHGVVGVFYERMKQLGIGYPTSDEAHTATEMHQWFGNAVLVQKKGTTAPFAVLGPILDKYKKLGGAAGILGCPLTDQRTTPDGHGNYNHFEHRASIYMKPTIGPHEVHGLIRDLWAKEGWETNPALGYPISDELPAKTRSANRFNDFENGVVYWKSGDKAAVSLFPINHQAPADMEASIRDAIQTQIENMPPPADQPDITGFTVTHGPSRRNQGIFGEQSGPWVTDYKWASNGQVENRRYMFIVDFDILVSGSADISVQMELDIELFWNRSTNKLMSRITNWNFTKIHVPWPTSDNDYPLPKKGVSAETVKGALNKAMLDAAKPRAVPDPGQKLANLAKTFNVLTFKTMPDGSLDTYVEPLAT